MEYDIKRMNGKYCIVDDTGHVCGTYDTHKEAADDIRDMETESNTKINENNTLMQNLSLGMRVNKGGAVKNNPLYDGDFSALKVRMKNAPAACKTVDDCNYLINDARIAFTSFNKLKTNLQSVIDGKPNKNVNVADMQKRIDKGLTVKKIEEYENWLKDVYIPALQERKQELKAAKKATNECTSPEMDAMMKLIGCELADEGIGATEEALEDNEFDEDDLDDEDLEDLDLDEI